MSWHPIPRKPGRSDGDEVSVAKSERRVTVAMPAELLRRLGWKIGGKVEVLVGADEHAGKLLVRSAASGLKLMKMASKSTRAAISPPLWPGLKPGKVGAQSVAYAIEDGALVVTLPPWGQPAQLDPVAAHIAKNGVTKCPTKFAAPVTGAGGADDAKKLAAVKLPEVDRDARIAELSAQGLSYTEISHRMRAAGFTNVSANVVAGVLYRQRQGRLAAE